MGYYGNDFYSDELFHHGILGQKWGVRRFQNKDGTRIKFNNDKKVSPRALKNARDVINNAKYDEDISKTVVKTLNGDTSKLKAADEAVDEFVKNATPLKKECEEMFEIFKDEGQRNYYEACSEIAHHAEYSGGVKNMTLEDVGWASYMGIFEDGQQSNLTKYSMYADEKNLGKKCVDIDSKYTEYYKDTQSKCKKAISDALGEVGNESVNPEKENGWSINEALTTYKMDSIKSPYLYEAMDGSYAETFTSLDRQNIKDAKELSSKVYGGGKDANGWYYLHDAAENLGLDQTKVSDMSDSDWKRLNAEIKKEVEASKSNR